MNPIDIWDTIVEISNDMKTILGNLPRDPDDQELALSLAEEITRHVDGLNKYLNKEGSWLITKSG